MLKAAKKTMLHSISINSKLLLIGLFALISCNSIEEENLFKKHLKTELGIKGVFSGTIVSLADGACHPCAEAFIEMIPNLPCNFHLLLDTNEFKVPRTVCPNKIHGKDNDFTARINFPNIFGHRMYFVYNDSIVSVKEINSNNVDSVLVFLASKN